MFGLTFPNAKAVIAFGRISGSMKDAFHGNRQRMQRSKEENLLKRRSEVVESGFAHICETEVLVAHGCEALRMFASVT